MPSARRTHRRNVNIRGHAHELTFSCNGRLPLLNAERTKTWLIESIQHAREKEQFDLWAWVIMPEHAHVLIRPRRNEYDIARIRSAIKEPVGRQAIGYLREHGRNDWLERLKRTRGSRIEYSFWLSGGGYDRNITEPKTLSRCLDYIHLNPIRRGLASNAEDWQWSSASWFIRGNSIPLPVDPIPPDWML